MKKVYEKPAVDMVKFENEASMTTVSGVFNTTNKKNDAVNTFTLQ